MRFNEKIKQLSEACIDLQSEMIRITHSPYHLATERDHLSLCQEKYKQSSLELGALLMDWLLQDVQTHGERFIYHPKYVHLSAYQNHIDLKDIFDFQDQLKKTQQAFSIKELTETTQLLEDSKVVIQSLNQEMNQILSQLNHQEHSNHLSNPNQTIISNQGQGQIQGQSQNSKFQAISTEREEDFVNQVLHENIGDQIPFIEEHEKSEESFYDDFLVDAEEIDPLHQILLEEHLQELASQPDETPEDLDKDLPFGFVESMINQMPLHDTSEHGQIMGEPVMGNHRLNILKNALKAIEDAVITHPVTTDLSTDMLQNTSSNTFNTTQNPSPSLSAQMQSKPEENQKKSGKNRKKSKKKK